MLKQEFAIRVGQNFKMVNGYVTEDGKYGIDKRKGTCQPNKDFWYITDIPTGLSIDGQAYATRKGAVADIERLESLVAEKDLRANARYQDAVKKLNEFKGIKTESEDKTMAKKSTKKSEKVNTKADEVKTLKSENEALRKEIELLKASIKALEPTAPKVTIDEFDVEGYMASRDDSARITPELVEALENTKGLTVTRKGKDEWLYVSGKTEADTKERKDIFKAMGFRWSAPESAWFIAPYPLRSKKSWGAKKARMAMATA